MRAAAIDVGSNSALLLAVDVDGSGVARPLVEALATTRLGTRLRRGGPLASDAVRRTRDAVVELAARARSVGADAVWGFATGAVRDAADGDTFARALAADAAIELEILSGEAEARFAYEAVAAAFPADGALLAVDIGGRTTELTLGRGELLVGSESVALGALALAETAFAADPPSREELETAADVVARELAASTVLSAARSAAARLTASGGTATALAAIDVSLTAYDPRRVHGHRITMERLGRLVRELLAMSSAARRALPGMDPGRAAILPAGALVLEYVGRASGAAGIVVSDHGVRHAYLRRRLARCGVAVERWSWT